MFNGYTMSLWKKILIRFTNGKTDRDFSPESSDKYLPAGLLAHLFVGLPTPTRRGSGLKLTTALNAEAYSCGDSYGITPYSLFIPIFYD